jgi:integrase
MSDQVFAACTEKTMPIAPDIAEHILVNLARFEIEAFECTRAAAPYRSADVAHADLHRETVLQEVLRRALLLRDRAAAAAPLRNIAEQLGITLDEDDLDWKRLAIEATKVLLDVSEERQRRDQGIYNGPTVYFRSAMAASKVEAPVPTHAPEMQSRTISPEEVSAQFASGQDVVLATRRSSTLSEEHATLVSAATSPPPAANESDKVNDLIHASLQGSTFMTPNQMPTPRMSGEGPTEFNSAVVQAARIAIRPPKITVEIEKFSPEVQSALRKKRGISMIEGLKLYIEAKQLGYGDNFEVKQVPEAMAGKKWAKGSGPKGKFALAFWSEMLGNPKFETVATGEILDALALLRRLPNMHGKVPVQVADDGYRDLVERMDEKEMEDAAARRADLSAAGSGSPAQFEAAETESLVQRISVATYLKHARILSAVGRMLYAMNLIDENPFQICSVSKADEARMRAHEGEKTRIAWDDRIYDLFRTEVFQGKTDEVGDPLFWAPLIARFTGGRMEEVLQLSPKDFGRDHGIDYLRITHSETNSIKSFSAERRVPIHPALVELGLLKLVALRLKQGEPRIFPHLSRGKAKETFSGNFTKSFTYYRQSRHVYWEGLDFHALRTTFHCDLLNGDRSDAIRRKLMGHAPVDMGEKSYSPHFSIKTLYERILMIGVDTSMIISPFKEVSRTGIRAQEHHLRIVSG